MRAIRAQERFEDAADHRRHRQGRSAGERQRCLDAGANDYVAQAGRPDRAARGASTLARGRAHRPRSRVRPGRSAAPERRHHLLEDSAIDGTKILVVDDDFRNIFAMTALLERGHAIVTVAESGAEALAMLERDAGHRHRADGHHDAGHGRLRHDPGASATRAVRATCPIIAVTGKVMAGERQRCLDAGADDFIPKPVDTAELLVGPGAVAARPRPVAA